MFIMHPTQPKAAQHRRRKTDKAGQGAFKFVEDFDHSVALLTMCISQCCNNRVLYWVYTDAFCFIYWAIRENTASAARPIWGINSSNIALPGRTILEVSLLEINNVCILFHVEIYGEIQPQPLGNPSGTTLVISLVLRLYFTVYPSSRLNTYTIFS